MNLTLSEMGDTPPKYNMGVADASGVTLAGKIMMGTIVTLFFVVVVILGIHIYARLYLWRRSGARRRRFEFDSVEEIAATHGLRKGVDPELLKSLPVVVFSTAEFKDLLECAVCLAEVTDGEKARILPNCKHGFHVGCIDMWLHSHSTCPLCRSPIGPPQGSEQEHMTTDNNMTLVDGSVNFPTNVLFWGNEVQVSSRIGSSEEGTSTSRPDESLVIDIPSNDTSNTCSSSSQTRFNEQEEMRSPLSARFRSLTRIWSMNKRIAPSTSNVEQGDERV